MVTEKWKCKKCKRVVKMGTITYDPYKVGLCQYCYFGWSRRGK